MLTSLCLALAACSVSTKSARIVPPPTPQIAAPDSTLLKACNRPVELGAAPLTQSRLEELWISDRSALLQCYRRHIALKNFIIDRDDALRGKVQP